MKNTALFTFKIAHSLKNVFLYVHQVRELTHVSM